jgi:hypothetical protein
VASFALLPTLCCLGQLETRLAIEELTRRFPRLRRQRLTFHPSISFRGPRALWVRAG